MAEVMEKVPQSAVARLEARIAELEAKLAGSAPPAPPPPHQEGLLTAEDKAYRLWLQKPLEERAQITADKMFVGPKRFECYLLNEDKTPPVKMKDCPSLMINANSPEEARARYQEINGIRHTERTIVADDGRRTAA